MNDNQGAKMNFPTPEFVTFTGIDARTDIARVEDLSSRYPVEWGILFSRNNTGKANRYPSWDTVAKFLSSPHLGATLKFSAHICGRYAHRIMEHTEFDQDLGSFIKGGFARTQINIADG